MTDEAKTPSSFSSKLEQLKEKLSVCKYIPVLNFLYYMIDDTPKKDDVETLLNTFGLISALMLTLSPLIISTVTSAELLAADGNYLGFGYDGERETGTVGVEIGKYGCLPVTTTSLAGGVSQLSVWIVGRVFISMSCVMLSLMISMLLLVSISTLPQLRDLRPDGLGKTVVSPTEAAPESAPLPPRAMKRKRGGLHESTNRAFEEAFPSWWSLAWVPIAGVVLPFLIYGTFTFLQSVYALALIKIPNDYRRQVCRENGWVFSHTDPQRGTDVYVNGTFPNPSEYFYKDCRTNIDCVFFSLATLVLPIAVVLVAMCVGYASLLFERRLDVCGHRILEEEREANKAAKYNI